MPLTMSSRVPCTSYRSPGKIGIYRETSWRIAKIITMPTTRQRSQMLQTIASWYPSRQRKHDTIKHWIEQHFTHKEKRQNKISSDSAAQCPIFYGFPHAFLLYHSGRNPVPTILGPPPHRRQIEQWGWPDVV